MQTTVKYLSDTKVMLTVSIGVEDLKAAEQVALTKLTKSVKVPGFRAGRVPAGVAAKHVDPRELQDATLDNALNKAVATAFLNERIQALDRPAVEVKKYVPREALEFTAEVDVVPKIKLGDYKALNVKAEKASVTPKDIDEILERMRTSFATKEEVKRAAKDGDEVVMDFVGKKEGVEFDGGSGTDYTLGIGSGQFIPGFEEGIVGHKVGETFDIDLSFPDDYHAKDLAGTKVSFTVTLKKVLSSTLPEVDDKLAAQAGPFKTVAELKADIKHELTKQKETESTEKFKDALLTELIKKSTVTAPEVLVEDQMKSIRQDFEQNLMYRGLSLESYLATNNFKDEDDWIEKEVKPTATRRVQAGLVLSEMTNVEKITATDAEIDEHVEVHKAQYKNNPEVLKQFETEEVRNDIANHYITEKTINRLIELNGGVPTHSH